MKGMKGQRNRIGCIIPLPTVIVCKECGRREHIRVNGYPSRIIKKTEFVKNYNGEELGVLSSGNGRFLMVTN